MRPIAWQCAGGIAALGWSAPGPGGSSISRDGGPTTQHRSQPRSSAICYAKRGLLPSSTQHPSFEARALLKCCSRARGAREGSRHVVKGTAAPCIAKSCAKIPHIVRGGQAKMNKKERRRAGRRGQRAGSAKKKEQQAHGRRATSMRPSASERAIDGVRRHRGENVEHEEAGAAITPPAPRRSQPPPRPRRATAEGRPPRGMLQRWRPSWTWQATARGRREKARSTRWR